MALLTVRETADRLGYTRLEVVLRLIESGSLPAFNTSASPGRRTWRIRSEDLDAWLESRRHVPTQPSPARRRKRAATPERTQYFAEY